VIIGPPLPVFCLLNPTSSKAKTVAHNDPKQMATILIPTYDTRKGHYEWPDLEVKKSVQSTQAGRGVFARRRLEKDTQIRYYGCKIDGNEEKKLEKEGKDAYICRLTDDILYNADAIAAPWDGIGGDGLFIAAMINEAALAAPNCEMVQFDNCDIRVCTLRAIEKGEELTSYYGPNCERSYPIWKKGKG